MVEIDANRGEQNRGGGMKTDKMEDNEIGNGSSTTRLPLESE